MPREIYTPRIVVKTEGLPKPDWLEYRRDGIGGSDVAIVAGLPPYQTKMDLYFDKLRIQPIEQEDKLCLEVGHALETVIAQKFSRLTGYQVIRFPYMLAHPHYP